MQDEERKKIAKQKITLNDYKGPFLSRFSFASGIDEFKKKIFNPTKRWKLIKIFDLCGYTNELLISATSHVSFIMFGKW